MSAQNTRDEFSCEYRGVDLIDSSLDTNPLCAHGPTLLFERFFKDKPSQKYYACSACRDRKECPFFQLYGEKLTNAKKFMQEETKKKLLKRKIIKKLCEGDVWCFSCDAGFQYVLLRQHKDHQTMVLSANHLMSPTTFIYPKEEKKSHAQYFFSEETCSVFLKTIKRMSFKNVLCVGAPRKTKKKRCQWEELNHGTLLQKPCEITFLATYVLLHEVLLSQKVNSLLLDIDKRFSYFYDTNSFLHYNMFNGFFFNNDIGNKKLETFLSQSLEDTLIVIDPPFGALVSLLIKILQRLWNVCNKELPTMIIFPYFLENQILEKIPSLIMMDYKVCYSNHPHFNNSKNRGSPIRIFTNIAVDKVALPTENYRFCKICNRYVYKENKHCKQCNKCTSKDGRSYVHCTICKICVKPDRIHCMTCSRCESINHKCQIQVDFSCHCCGKIGHKRKDCPNLEIKTMMVEKKRKSLFKGGNRKKLCKAEM
nr:rRNA N6-adenosine-methyltransferase ZCCHC4-like [Hydra vulgaris]